MSHELFSPRPMPARLAAVVRVRDFVLQVRSALKAWRNRRSAMALLASMDAHMLKDIGLTHGDVHSALAEPTWTDPTVRLKLLVVERRASARARARDNSNRVAASAAATPTAAALTRPQAESLNTSC